MDKQNIVNSFKVVAVTFIIGSIAGTFMGSVFRDSATTIVSDTTFVSRLFSIAVFPVISVFLGTSLLGVVALPILTGLKGFSITFSLTALLSGLEHIDRLAFLKTQLVPVIVSVPILMLLTAQALNSSVKLVKVGMKLPNSGAIYGSHYWLTVILCFCALTLAAVYR